MYRLDGTEWKDHRGTTLEVGQKVAYNLSGEIAYGEIIEIKARRMNVFGYGQDLPNIKIKQFLPHEGKISKVRQAKNVMVLTEEGRV